MTGIYFPFYCFCLFYLIQSYFLIRYFINLAFNKPTSQKKSPHSPVSVIICSHNEINNLKSHLKKILEQNYSNFEVVVMDDRSDDGSYEWLIKLQEKYRHLEVKRIESTPEDFNPKKYALSEGIQAAQHDLILLTDADCKVNSKRWIAKMAQSYKEETEIVLGASLYEKHPGFLNAFIRFETLQTAILYLSLALKGKPYMGIGRNLSYRKSLFLKSGGFNDYANITGGDDDLFVNKQSNSLNTRVCIDENSTTFSKPKTTLEAFIKQKKRHLSVGKYYRKKDQVRIGVFHLSQTLLWIFFIFVLGVSHTSVIFLVILLMVLRIIGQYVVFYKVSIKFGEHNKLRLLPILEIIFIFYYWIIGIHALLSKKVKWR